MPLPLLIGAAVISGLYGAKKGYDAKVSYDVAEIYNNEAKEIFEEAQESLDFSRKKANESLEKLGSLKYELATNHFAEFHQTWNILTKKYPELLQEYLHTGHHKVDSFSEEGVVKSLEESRIESSELVSGGVAALGSGGVAGLAAYGSVGMLGTASTGTAIGSLSGAAATNATLAWLGGGSLASGGLGMAGGYAVLGGFLAGPVLAVGGMILASKAEESKEKAKENVVKAKVAAREMKIAETTTKAIKKSCNLSRKTLKDLSKVLELYLKEVTAMIKNNSSDDEIRPYAMIMLAAFETSFTIYKTKALTEDGTSNPKMEDVLVEQKGKFDERLISFNNSLA